MTQTHWKPGGGPPAQLLDTENVSPRRAALRRLFALTSLTALSMAGTGCGGSSPAPAPVSPTPPPPPPSPPPPPPTPLSRLKTALLKPAVGVSTANWTVLQGNGNSLQSTLGPGVQIFPPLDNPGAQSLATVPQVWGFRRDRWTVPPAGAAVIAGQNVFPVTRSHVSPTRPSGGLCGLHFMLQGSAFEILFAGQDVGFTLVVDGQYMSSPSTGSGFITTNLANGAVGAPLTRPNTFIRVDFGSAAARKVSLYGRSTQGPCALAVAAGDTLTPWDRSEEASMAAMADSYGGSSSAHWGGGGIFYDAAALLGIPHPDLDAVGGTGYAPNSVFNNPGDAFPSRLANSVDTQADLFISAGGINDNNSFALPPYATVADAAAGFIAGTRAHFRGLRSALPNTLLVALGPWAPRQNIPTDPVTQSKADAILAELRAAGGPWVFLDNLNGGWQASSGASSLGTGPWQTGTGNSGAPAGNGNGDQFLSSDGVHPNLAGSTYLGGRMAADLRSALATFT